MCLNNKASTLVQNCSSKPSMNVRTASRRYGVPVATPHGHKSDRLSSMRFHQSHLANNRPTAQLQVGCSQCPILGDNSDAIASMARQGKSSKAGCRRWMCRSLMRRIGLFAAGMVGRLMDEAQHLRHDARCGGSRAIPSLTIPRARESSHQPKPSMQIREKSHGCKANRCDYPNGENWFPLSENLMPESAY